MAGYYYEYEQDHFDITMLRLVEQAMHHAFAVEQDYRTREVLLFTGVAKCLSIMTCQ
jgi:hypothetical protein